MKLVALLPVFALLTAGAGPPLHFLITNDDTATVFPPSSVSFYPIAADGRLGAPVSVVTGGNGVAGGYFGTTRVIVSSIAAEDCIYASNAQSESISGIDIQTHKLDGPFHGSHPDNKLARNGISLAVGNRRLYAAFSGSGNIGVFEMQAGCALRFVGDVHVQGLRGGYAEAMAIHGNTLVAAYGDGSIESFDINGGMPASHGDAQFSTGSQTDFAPDAVDLTRDGHFAIFGGASTAAGVEVSDISSGRLSSTVIYHLGTAWNSSSVRLSPDESLLYLPNSSGGRVTAAFFDKTTGKVLPGCTSAPLRGYYHRFTYIGAVATELATGKGGLLYVPELGTGKQSYIGVLRFAAAGTGCTLTETVNSPVSTIPASRLLSIGVYPQRGF